MKPLVLLIAVISIAVMGVGLTGLSTAAAADKENCLMCHKYPSMARIEKDGLVRNYYVDEHLFLNSLHGKVGCRECHTYIKKFPHDPATEKVNCANTCHIKPPFSEQNFSHKKIIDVFNTSVHAVKPDDSTLMRKSKPDCKYCHLNPLYKRVDENKISYGKTLDRCLNCHKRKGVTVAYRHMTHRLRHKTSRSSREIVSLCAENCHGNIPLMKKLGVSEEAREAVETYKESIHGKASVLGSEKSADCISCHASSMIHDIYKKDDPRASIFTTNMMETCKQCHAKRNMHFVKIAVHPSIKKTKNPFLFFAEIGLRILLYAVISGLLGLLFLETVGRKRDGIRLQLRAGTSWRRRKGIKR